MIDNAGNGAIEMQLLRTARDVLAKQWEDALTAMRKVTNHCFLLTLNDDNDDGTDE